MNQTSPLMQFKKREDNACPGLESVNYNHITGLWEDENEAPLISTYFTIDRAQRSDLRLRTIITESGEGIDRSERSV